jgi:hypothetical protein
MKIYNWTAPRLYGFIANILLVISWIAMLFFLTWSTAVQNPVQIIIFIIAAVAIIGCGIITIALSTAVPAYRKKPAKLAGSMRQHAILLSKLLYRKTILLENLHTTSKSFSL